MEILARTTRAGDLVNELRAICDARDEDVRRTTAQIAGLRDALDSTATRSAKLEVELAPSHAIVTSTRASLQAIEENHEAYVVDHPDMTINSFAKERRSSASGW